MVILYIIIYKQYVWGNNTENRLGLPSVTAPQYIPLLLHTFTIINQNINVILTKGSYNVIGCINSSFNIKEQIISPGYCTAFGDGINPCIKLIYIDTKDGEVQITIRAFSDNNKKLYIGGDNIVIEIYSNGSLLHSCSTFNGIDVNSIYGIIMYIIDFTISDNNDGTYTFIYNTFSSIYYPLTIYIKAQSKKYVDVTKPQNINNSPFTIGLSDNIVIKPNEIYIKDKITPYIINELEYLTLSSTISFPLYKYTKLSDYNVQFIPTASECKIINQNNEYKVQFKLKKTGLYKLFVFYKSLPILKAPYLIEGIYGEIDLNNTIILPEIQQILLINKKYKYEITLCDKNKNIVTSSINYLSCWVTGKQTVLYIYLV